MLAYAPLLLFVSIQAAASEEASFSKKTYTFKTVDGIAIQADVHRLNDDKVRPVVVWLHGGALIMGNRVGVLSQILNLCRKEGYALVSFDYRLAPGGELPDIIHDIEGAFRWLRPEGPKLVHLD